jgi:hypothetical protein
VYAAKGAASEVLREHFEEPESIPRLDIVESLPEEQQETLIDIIRRRLMEHRKDVLAEHIKETREEYKRGEVRHGAVDDLMKELEENENADMG